MKKIQAIYDTFLEMSPEAIIELTPGKFSDDQLLDVFEQFEVDGDLPRARAVKTLLLRSPDWDEMLDYPMIYVELLEEDEPRFHLPWIYAALLFDALYGDAEQKLDLSGTLATLYAKLGQVETALQIATRALQRNPNDLSLYGELGWHLTGSPFNPIAVEIAERFVQFEDSADWDSELMLQEARAYEGDTSACDALDLACRQAFQAALLLRDPRVPQNTPLPPLDDLSAADDIVALGPLVVAELIQMLPDSDEAIALLRRIEAPELVELRPFLSATQDPDWRDLLSVKVGKIRLYRFDEMQAVARNNEVDPFVRANAARGMMMLADKRPDLRDQIISSLRRLLQLGREYPSAQEELFTSNLITEIGEWGEQSLYPDIKAALDEDRIDPTITDLQYIEKELGVPISPVESIDGPGLYVKIVCRGCGRTRHRYVEHVLVELATERKEQEGIDTLYGSHVIDRQFVCAHCGAVDRYDLHGLDQLRLTLGNAGPEEIAAALSGDRSVRLEGDPRVTRAETVAFGNRRMHPLETLARYTQLISRSPDNAENYFRTGNIYRLLHRNEEALEVLRRGYAVGYDSAEGVLNLAMAEHDFGDKDKAEQLYQEAMASIKATSGFPDPDDLAISVAASQGLKALRQRRPSPFSHPQQDGPPVKPLERRKKQKRRKKRRKKR